MKERTVCDLSAKGVEKIEGALLTVSMALDVGFDMVGVGTWSWGEGREDGLGEILGAWSAPGI